jgi:hypothetical protein
MTNINFPHPCDPNRKPLFLDLHYQIYDLMKLRYQLRLEFCQAIEPSEMFEPRLPAELQAALEALERAADDVRAGASNAGMHHRALQEIDTRRDEIFARADALGIGAWQAEMRDAMAPHTVRARLRYCEHCLAQVRARIEALRTSTSLLDPFAMLEEKCGLDDDEVELLTFLYYRQFERPQPLTGVVLLSEVMGRQSGIFRGQEMLFEAWPLIANGLAEVVERGSGVMDATYAVTKWANLVISGLHPDHPHQVVEWKSTAGRSTDDEPPGLRRDDTVVYAGDDADRVAGLARWCLAKGMQMYVARPGSPDLIAVPCFAMVVEAEFTACAEWSDYLAYRNDVIRDGSREESGEAVIVSAGDRDLADVCRELAAVAAQEGRGRRDQTK